MRARVNSMSNKVFHQLFGFAYIKMARNMDLFSGGALSKNYEMVYNFKPGDSKLDIFSFIKHTIVVLTPMGLSTRC